MVHNATAAVLLFIVHRMYVLCIYVCMYVCVIHSCVARFVMLFALPGDPGTLTW